ncbi:uncharacterized protein [Gossypium hirsutum]|uniref:Reverse transcriptase/retrotransposon-derived protein RNase H-like domain-containing protein n=1 Tax=Gossypium hirsutum TaxID=3635 RepID=A0A1U8NVX8_GOSHI|nr:uncharacterized protein LOC107952259 [Gossypium hirsutum]
MGDEVVVIGERQNYLSNVISALRAKKLVRKGCEADLAYTSALDTEVSSVKDIKRVKDFPDVFPDVLPGLPPNHKVEFGIEPAGYSSGVPFDRIDKQQESFERLKKVLTEAPVLIQPEFEKKFIVYSDISNVGLGCVLMQEGEQRVLGLELISDIEDKVRLIRDRLKEASNRQKSYADPKRKEIEYSMGDLVFLKVSPWKNALRRYRSDLAHIILTEAIVVRPDLTFEEELIQILDHDVKVLRKKSILLDKFFFEQSVGA